MPNSYAISLTKQAEEVYVRMHGECERCLAAGDETNSKVTAFRMVEELLEKIIPHDPFNTDRALAGRLSNMFRVKKGRIRVAYIASSKRQRIVILYISDTLRKDGDVQDPYMVLTKLIASGEFDKVFGELGVRKPKKSSAASVAIH